MERKWKTWKERLHQPLSYWWPKNPIQPKSDSRKTQKLEHLHFKSYCRLASVVVKNIHFNLTKLYKLMKEMN